MIHPRLLKRSCSKRLQAGGHRHSDAQQLIHGTTLVTNAIIERKGSRTALLATQGFRDSIEIGRENRYELYDLMLEMPQPLVPRYLRFDVPQRTLADGTTLQELDVAFVEQLARELAANGIEAVAIAFLNSFANPAAEREARAARAARRAATCASPSRRRSCLRYASLSAPQPRLPTSMCRTALRSTCANCRRGWRASASRAASF